MKKGPIINEELMDKINDSYLDGALKDYQEVKSKYFSQEEDDKYYNALNDILKILAYRAFITLFEIQFLDSHTDYLFRKGRLPEGYDYLNDPKVKSSPLYADIREKGSNSDYKRYVIILTSPKNVKELSGFNCVTLTEFKDFYEKYIVNDSKVLGVIINPGIDNLIINKELCKYVYNDCPKDFWNDFVSKMRSLR